MGRQDVGFLHVRTGRPQRLDRRKSSPSGACANACWHSRMSARCTRRDPHGSASAARQTAGVDFRLATSRFPRLTRDLGTGYLRHQSRSRVTMAVRFRHDRRHAQRPLEPAVWARQLMRTSTRDRLRDAPRLPPYQPTCRVGPRPRGNKSVAVAFSVALDTQTTDLENMACCRARSTSRCSTSAFTPGIRSRSWCPKQRDIDTHSRRAAASRLVPGADDDNIEKRRPRTAEPPLSDD